MKRLLSILLALSMVISIIPVTFAAEGDPEVYNFTAANNVNAYLAEVTDYNSNKGYKANDTEHSRAVGNTNWYYFDAPENIEVLAGINGEMQTNAYLLFLLNSVGIRMEMKRSEAGAGSVGAEFSLALKAPAEKGFYIPSLGLTYSGSCVLKWYIGARKSGESSYGNYVNDEMYVIGCSPNSSTTSVEAKKIIYSDAETELISAFKASPSAVNQKYKSVTLTKVQNAKLHISADKTELNTTDNATASITATVTGDNLEGSMDIVRDFVKYYSDNEDVATVDENTGVITAGNTAGTAKITAQSPDGEVKSNEITVTVTAPEAPGEPGEEVTNTKVSVAVQPENTDEGTVSWGGATIDEVNMGDTVSATATAKEGYVFRYWKNSAGQVISDNPNESFVINTNSAITAVFDKVDDTANTVSVELYNANGMPFDSKNVNKGTTFADAISGVGTPTYTGFGTFKHWSMYSNEAKIEDNMLIKENTRAVAIFNAPTEKYTVKVNGEAEHGDVLYGTEVTVSSDAANFSCWKLGEKIVSYEKNYKFTVWGDVELTEVTGEEVTEAPVAVLDKVDGNPLLIYSVPEDYTIVEAGIIFGSTADITIYSVDGGRAVAARRTGQFTAQAKDSGKAISRGYLIFKKASGEIRILYAE